MMNKKKGVNNSSYNFKTIAFNHNSHMQNMEKINILYKWYKYNYKAKSCK